MNALAFDSVGDMLASGSDDTTVRLWNVSQRHLLVCSKTQIVNRQAETRKCVQTLRGFQSNVFAVKFLAGGEGKVVAGSNDADVRCFHAGSGDTSAPVRLAQPGAVCS